MPRNKVRKHMEQNLKSFQGFAFAFCRMYRRASRRQHARLLAGPFDSALQMFNADAIQFREQVQ